MAPSPTDSTARLFRESEYERERRGWLWGGLVDGVSTIVGGAGCGTSGGSCVTTSGTPRGALGSALSHGVE